MNTVPPNYDYDMGSIRLAGLQLHDLPENIEFEGNVLLRKSEFHITLICNEKVALLIDAAKAGDVEEEIAEEFKRYVKNEPFTEYDSLNNYRFVQRGEQKTLILMVEVPRLVDFFNRLERKYHKSLPLQPTHITLYTLPPDVIGIGLLSQEELNRDSRPVQKPDFPSLSIQ